MDWNDAASTWDDDPAVRAYADAAYASLQAALAEAGASLAGMRVLDFGCGTGLLTASIAGEARAVVGFDVAPAMVAGLASKGLANVEAQSGALADVASGFDAVTCSSVCAFLDDYPATVAALVERLVPGGWFVQWDWEFDPDAEEPFGLSREAIRTALHDAGLIDVQVRTGFEVRFGEYTMAPMMGLGRRP